METKKTQSFLSWSAPEFIFYPKTRTWFVVLFIIATAFFITAILLKNYFFALLIPIATFLLYIHAQKKPRQIKIEITEKNINIGQDVSLSYKELISFWIFEEDKMSTLSLETKKPLQQRVHILLENQEPAAVRETLRAFIKEKKHEEHFTDIIAKKLKF